MRAIFLILGLLGHEASQSTSTAAEKWAAWAGTHCQSVAEEVFRPHRESLVATRPANLVIEVAVSGEFIRETVVLLSEVNGFIEAIVVQAEGGAICDQAEAIYSRHEGLSVEEIAKLIKTSSRIEAERSLPELRRLYDSLRDIPIQSRVSRTIFLPSRYTKFSITNGLEKVLVAFNQAEPLAESAAYADGSAMTSQPELAAWIEKLFEVLKLLRR